MLPSPACVGFAGIVASGMSQDPVAIIGGGLAGLCAARELRAADVPFVLLEARERLGGRILTVDGQGDPSADDGFDLGPSWFWPRAQPAIGALIEALQLPVFAQFSGGDVIFERMSREGPRRYQSAEQEPLSFRLAGGTAALVRRLSCDLEPAQQRLGAHVTGLALHGHGVELTIGNANGGQERMAASHVIAALPPRLLDASVTFVPAVDPRTVQLWRGTPTWMAPHAKFFAVYDRPFWREDGLCGTAQSMVGPMPEVHDATTASGQPALFGFVGVSAGQRAVLGEEALARACVAQLARMFGDAAATPVATLLKDWAADPLTATGRDQIAGGHPVPPEIPWVSGDWSERLMLGGSEVSPSEPGYLAGAVVAGQQTAQAVIRRRTGVQ